MPAKSAKQEKFMQAVANNPKFAKKVGVPTSVGKEFTKSGGGMAESKKMMAKEVAFMKKKGAPKSMVKHEMAEAGMKKGNMIKKYANGGTTDKTFDLVKKIYEKSGANIGPRQPIPSDMVKRINEDMDKMGIGGKKTSKAKGGVIKKYAAGGSVGASKMGKVVAGGIKAHGEHTVQKKGHTKAKMVKMAGGGKSGKYC